LPRGYGDEMDPRALQRCRVTTATNGVV
jgi:hypothetical protein